MPHRCASLSLTSRPRILVCAADSSALFGRTELRSRFLRIAVILAATIVGGLTGLARVDSGPSTFTATTLFVSTYSGPSAEAVLNSYATLIGSSAFRDQLATDTGEELDDSSLAVAVPAGTGLISVTVRADSAEQVMAISRQILLTFQEVAAGTTPDVDITTALVDVFGKPSAPERDESGRTWPLAAGALLGLGLGFLIVGLWPARQPIGVADLRQAGEASGLPFRATVPDLHDPKETPNANPSDAAYALLRAGTDRWWRRPVQLIVLVPCTRDRRALDLAVDLAAVAAESGNRTLLVDADLQRGGLSHYLNRQDRPGVTDAKIEHGRIQFSVTTVADGSRSGLSFLPNGAGTTDATNAIIGPLVTQLDEFDVTIALAPPFDEDARLAELLEAADGILVVGIARKTTDEELVAVGDLVHTMAATDRTAGVLLGADRLALAVGPMEAVGVG